MTLVVLLSGCATDDFKEITGVCPVVVSTNPDNGAILVPLDQVISVTFNEPMDPSSINSSTFKVLGTGAVAGTISYSGLTASFTPSAALSPNTTYSVRMSRGATDLNGIALKSDYVFTFSTGSTLTPMVVSTDPANGETNVFLNKIVAVTFNVPMNPASINGTTITLKQGITAVTGTVTYNNNVAYFTPNTPLTANTVYTGTVTTGATNLQGTGIASNYVWTFTTGTLSATMPLVISTDPANNATGVVLNKTLTASFNMVMDPLTLNGTTFTLKQGLTPIAGVVTYFGVTASFNPTVDLMPNTLYTATITTGAKNAAGTALAANYVWTFTTGSTAAPQVISTNPLTNASNVNPSQNVTATFNMAMDPTTITALSFTLKQGLTPVAGVVTYSGTTATFNPSADLATNMVYTATVTTLAKNVAGTSLANDYVWNFNTNTNVIASPIDLRSVARFGIIAGVGVSNNAGFSEIHDLDVGISPGVRSSITGFPPAIIVNGAIYASDDIAPPGVAAMLIQAKADLTQAYLAAEGATTPAPATVSGDLGGITLAPGIYKSTSTLMILNGDLTLDAQGDPNAFWIFQVASALTTVGGAGGNVILSGGAQAKNVYWQTGSSATIGNYTIFKGNVLALSSITMGSHATAQGRMLARNGAVVMTDTNIITKP